MTPWRKWSILSALAEVDLERGQYLTARCSLCMLCWDGEEEPSLPVFIEASMLFFCYASLEDIES